MTEYNCTGQCDTCTVDHSIESANRGHGISYSPLAIQYAQSTKYLNRDDNFNQILTENNEDIFFGEFGSFACGDVVSIWVKLDKDLDTILDAKFLSTGCYGSLSSSAYGCEQIIGKKLFEIDSKLLTQDIMNTLQLPEIKKHCSVFIGMCLNQIKEKIGKIDKDSKK